jgi:hypothetical protein
VGIVYLGVVMSNTTTNYTKGEQVIIKEEWSDGDHRFPTIVIEDRGDRVLVMHDCGFTINPTEVVLKEWIY